MLEILYRIYQVAENDEFFEENQDFHFYESISNTKNIELTMDCMMCETRDDFKNIIRDLYGKDIKFTYSRKLQPGDIYCIIIGEHCWNSEKYFVRYDFECDYCHTICKGYVNKPVLIDSWDLSGKLLKQIDKYGNKKFCCSKCMARYVQEETDKIKEESDGENIWVNRGDFKGQNVVGYIYKITKKSTGEFYVGQTIYEPMFRWVQHLATERFKIDNILDYQYETIEIVYSGTNILEREKYWIQKCYKENPSLSLNIAQTKNIVYDDDNLEEIKQDEQNNNNE